MPTHRNMLRPTMLRYVALACCDRLAGALTSSGALHHYIKTPHKHIGFLIEKLQFVDFSRIMNAIMELFRENNYEAQLMATREIQEERSPLI